MKRSILALLCLLPAPAQAVFMDCLFNDGLELAGAPANWAVNLRLQNCARKTVVPAASPSLGILTWSASLASGAQTWANTCTWGHSGAAGLGENLYGGAVSSGFPTNVEHDAITNPNNFGWADEFPFYNYAANTCASGQQCGHYTQMVWRATTQVGCALKQCTTGSPFGAQFPNWTVVVCRYSPQGNFTGQRPY
ncbi:CAP domain-containing protein [Tahibacter soli]|jgi:hypothetical protein|uniref:CAP domain-containing protein n=1 Tax=Tahibacter soli TaxID=2983605 RepID=A0A9X3YGX3_9GAMM|nr:CAP domain-containing protein [Tahibacter soli]MDC8012006.1 CAP domain-containing protein [Tahibacter soli]